MTTPRPPRIQRLDQSGTRENHAMSIDQSETIAVSFQVWQRFGKIWSRSSQSQLSEPPRGPII